MWEELVFAAIGEVFEDSDVVGVVLSIRPKEDALSIWNNDHANLSLRNKIGEKLKEIWELPADSQIEYKNHSASIKDRSTYRSHLHNKN
jgi:translation initiation factor 4E